MARFKQGQSGNPKGRPKGSVSITTAIKDKLQEINPNTKKQYLYDLVNVMIEKAIKEKDFRVIREIWNHIDGSPRQTTEVLGGNALALNFDSAFNVSDEARERFEHKANNAITSYLENARL